MGIKIIELSAANVIKDDDYFPITQSHISDSVEVRDTYKVTSSSIKSFIINDINEKLSNLEGLVNNSTLTKDIFNSYVKLSGDTMTGNLDLSGHKIQNFLANIIEYTDSITLSSSHNGSIVLMNKEATAGDAIITIEETPKLPDGFNVMIIQTGDASVKITKNGNVTICQSNNSLSTRKKYSQINICVLQQTPYTIWMSGDMV